MYVGVVDGRGFRIVARALAIMANESAPAKAPSKTPSKPQSEPRRHRDA
jgi:hypothetical protein